MFETAQSDSPVISIRDLKKSFRSRKSGWLGARREGVLALKGVDLDLHRGEWLGLVGESGSGKTTLARIAVGLEAPTSGTVKICGIDVASIKNRDRPDFARKIQFVYQNSFGALDPRMTAAELVAEPLIIHRRQYAAMNLDEKVAQLLNDVGLESSIAGRRPRQLSGGQCQRLSLARALALSPEVLVMDEPTSALDVTVQAQVIALLDRISAQKKLSVLVISHDLALVSQICHRTAVMYLGEIVEVGPTDQIVHHPAHSYTRKLINAVPRIAA
ncbi:ABC transporter ATP-binding protein [Candidimonas nitroreducens]|uniref:ABC transporter ATP-binding protein n=1 Tax=Candidimonas nitroreducens TaxID=683354 RepID=UPI0013033903|nr:ABC transporter ATP-binding protein [Candidimonas nitroreducens]